MAHEEIAVRRLEFDVDFIARDFTDRYLVALLFVLGFLSGLKTMWLFGLRNV